MPPLAESLMAATSRRAYAALPTRDEVDMSTNHSREELTALSDHSLFPGRCPLVVLFFSSLSSLYSPRGTPLGHPPMALPQWTSLAAAACGRSRRGLPATCLLYGIFEGSRVTGNRGDGRAVGRVMRGCLALREVANGKPVHTSILVLLTNPPPNLSNRYVAVRC